MADTTSSRFKPTGPSGSLVDTVTRRTVSIDELIFTTYNDGSSHATLQMRLASDLSLIAETDEIFDRDGNSKGDIIAHKAIAVDAQYIWIAVTDGDAGPPMVMRLNWSDMTFNEFWRPADVTNEVPSGLATDRVRVFRVYETAKRFAANTRGKPFRELAFHISPNSALHAIAAGKSNVYACQFFSGDSESKITVLPRDTFTPVLASTATPSSTTGEAIAIDDEFIYAVGNTTTPFLTIYHRKKLLVGGTAEAYKDTTMSWSISGETVAFTHPYGVAVDDESIFIAGKGTVDASPATILVQLHKTDSDAGALGAAKAYVALDASNAREARVACLPPHYESELDDEPQKIEAHMAFGLGQTQVKRTKIVPPTGILGFGMSLLVQFIDRVTRMHTFPWFGYGFKMLVKWHDLVDPQSRLGIGLTFVVDILTKLIRGSLGFGLSIDARILSSRSGFPPLVILHDTGPICPTALAIYHEGEAEPAEIPAPADDGILPAETPGGSFDGGTTG